jgi:dipeptidyl aminopeptidase/acylaminoacyl peptidase
VRFLRARSSQYSIDHDRIGAVGFSAGAHLSMMLGVTDKDDDLEGMGGSAGHSSKVQAVVSYFGPTDLLAPDIPTITHPILDKFLGGKPAEKREAYLAASPLQYVSPGDAPMLLFQGTNDPLVPYSQAVAMTVAMHRAGVPGRIELLPGLSHGWGGADLNHTVAATLAFFDLHLRGKQEKSGKSE